MTKANHFCVYFKRMRTHTVDTEKLMPLEDPVLKFRYGSRHFVSDIHCKPKQQTGPSDQTD